MGAQLVEAAEQALGVVGGRRGQGVAGLEQGARQVELGAVDGEQAGALPEAGRRARRHLLQDGVVQLAEDGGADLGAGFADGGGRDRPRLGQLQPQQAALLPQIAQHCVVAATVGGERQPEHEQHHQQRVERPPPSALPGPGYMVCPAVGISPAASSGSAPAAPRAVGSCSPSALSPVPRANRPRLVPRCARTSRRPPRRPRRCGAPPATRQP